jgi:hypothetical protein
LDIKEKMQIARHREIIGIALTICGLVSFLVGYFYNGYSTLFMGSFSALLIIGASISIYYERRYYSLKLEIERKTQIHTFY